MKATWVGTLFPTFLINAIKWLDEGRKSGYWDPTQPKGSPHSTEQIWFRLQLTGFREDLSVYVCTSYSDAQCAEIQELLLKAEVL